jgi:aspartyl-tRNA(Asn)/glutamyl-tRNA(Gln) amidotransferase subunit B
MRSKEEANDYRYFPDPDLLPVELDAAFIESVRATLPELPDQKAARLASQYGLSAYDAGVLTASRELAAYYEDVVREVPGEPKLAANWVMGELAAALNKENLEVTSGRLPATQLAGLLQRIADQTISGKIAKEVFEAMWTGAAARMPRSKPRACVRITDTSAIERVIDEVLARNPGSSPGVPRGKDKLFGFLRRPGDEGDRRQSQSGSSQRAAEEEARPVTDVRRRGTSEA